MDTPAGMDNTERLQAPVLMKDLSADTRWPVFSAELTNRGFGCLLAVPLKLGTNASAALSFFAAAPRIFTEEIIKDAELFGEVA